MTIVLCWMLIVHVNPLTTLDELVELYFAVPHRAGRVSRVRYLLFNPRFVSISINLSDRSDRRGYGSQFDDVIAKTSGAPARKGFWEIESLLNTMLTQCGWKRPGELAVLASEMMACFSTLRRVFTRLKRGFSWRTTQRSVPWLFKGNVNMPFIWQSARFDAILSGKEEVNIFTSFTKRVKIGSCALRLANMHCSVLLWLG